MKLSEGKEKFIASWGNLGMNWGINKTMGQVHALLLVCNKPLSAEEVMNHLKISRGNANMNIRALIDWGLVHKHFVPGERKEFFIAEKDIWKVFKKIIEHRKKKELDPLLEVLNDISIVKPNCDESEEFCRVVKELQLYSNKADKALHNVIQSKSNWLVTSFIKMMR